MAPHLISAHVGNRAGALCSEHPGRRTYEQRYIRACAMQLALHPKMSKYEDEKHISDHIENADVNTIVEPKYEDVITKIQDADVQDRQYALEMAMKADPGPKFGTWRHTRFYLICLLICMSPGDWGESPPSAATNNRLRRYSHCLHQLHVAVPGLL